MFKLIHKRVPSNAKNDILSGLTVALALVPEAVAFALLAGLNPLVGLYAAFTIGIVTSILGGRPGMISGATGAIAVVIGTLVALHGVEYLFAAVNQKGSEHRDPITPEGFTSNNSGGILGGISSGQDLLVSIALKPTSSIRLPTDSIDKKGYSTEISTTGRHDPCVGIRATPIAEAMLAITLMDHALRHRAQNADVVSETPSIPASKQ